MTDRCEHIGPDGQQCNGAAHHESSMNATPHTFGISRMTEPVDPVQEARALLAEWRKGTTLNLPRFAKVLTTLVAEVEELRADDECPMCKYTEELELERDGLLALARESKARLSQLEGERDRLEMEVRRMLWLGHGHREVLYGDDGEMQCSSCQSYGVVDYKRDPLADVRRAAHQANLAALTLIQEPPTRQPEER